MLTFWNAGYGLLIALNFLILTILDWKFQRAPFTLSLPMVATTFLHPYSRLNHGIWMILSFFLMTFGVFIFRQWVQKKQAKTILGNGDWPLLWVIGVFLPLQAFPLFFFLSGGLGLLTVFFRKSSTIPFVPALSSAFFITWTIWRHV